MKGKYFIRKAATKNALFLALPLSLGLSSIATTLQLNLKLDLEPDEFQIQYVNPEPLTINDDGQWPPSGTPFTGARFDFDVPDVFQDPLRSREPFWGQDTIALQEHVQAVCQPETTAGEVLSLMAAMDIAICNNPQLKAAAAAIKVQAAGVGEARASFLPTINGSFSLLDNKTDYPQNAVSNTHNGGQTLYASLTWRLLDFGGRSASHAAAETMLTAALQNQNATLQKMLGGVVSAYFDASSAQVVLAARTQARDFAQRTLAATERLERQGAGSRNDTLQAEAAFAKAKLIQQRAHGDYRRALSSLAQILGIQPSQEIILSVPETTTLTRQNLNELETWLMQARQSHPAILAAQAQRDASIHRVAALRSEGMPSVDFVVNHNRNGFPNQGLQATKSNTTNFGIMVNVPLFEGFGRTYKIRGAQAQVEQSQAQLLETEHQILAEISKAYADALAATENLEASENLLKTAQAAVESTERRYLRGASSILDMLSTQSALADALQERAKTKTEWYSARLRLLANSGLFERQNF